MNNLNKERDERTGRFLPGHVFAGSPTRAMLNRLFRECATPEHVAELWKLHWQLCHSDDEKVRLSAICSLEDRLFGRSDLRLEVETQARNEFQHVPTAELMAELAKLSASRSDSA